MCAYVFSHCTITCTKTDWQHWLSQSDWQTPPCKDFQPCLSINNKMKISAVGQETSVAIFSWTTAFTRMKKMYPTNVHHFVFWCWSRRRLTFNQIPKCIYRIWCCLRGTLELAVVAQLMLQHVVDWNPLSQPVVPSTVIVSHLFSLCVK